MAGHHRRDRCVLPGQLLRPGGGPCGPRQPVRRRRMPVEREYVFPELRTGMDHDHYDWSPLNATRALLRWPGNANVALCVIVTLEHMEWSRPPGHYQIPNLAGGYGQGPFPDVTAWSHREYGHRVGIFRVLNVLDKYGIKPTIALDALTAEHYPFLGRRWLAGARVWRVCQDAPAAGPGGPALRLRLGQRRAALCLAGAPG